MTAIGQSGEIGAPALKCVAMEEQEKAPEPALTQLLLMEESHVRERLKLKKNALRRSVVRILYTFIMAVLLF